MRSQPTPFANDTLTIVDDDLEWLVLFKWTQPHHRIGRWVIAVRNGLQRKKRKFGVSQTLWWGTSWSLNIGTHESMFTWIMGFAECTSAFLNSRFYFGEIVTAACTALWTGLNTFRLPKWFGINFFSIFNNLSFLSLILITQNQFLIFFLNDLR